MVTAKSPWLTAFPRRPHWYKVTPGKQGLSAKQGVKGLRDFGGIGVGYGKGSVGFRLVVHSRWWFVLWARNRKGHLRQKIGLAPHSG